MGDLGYRQPGPVQKFAGSVEPHVAEVLHRGDADFRAEQAPEVGFRQVCMLGHGRQVKLGVAVFVAHEADRGFHRR